MLSTEKMSGESQQVFTDIHYNTNSNLFFKLKFLSQDILTIHDQVSIAVHQKPHVSALRWFHAFVSTAVTTLKLLAVYYYKRKHVQDIQYDPLCRTQIQLIILMKMQKDKVMYCGGGKFRKCQTPRHWAPSM
jgi:hypothetical protein